MNKEKGFTEVKTSVVLGISGQAMSPKVILSKKNYKMRNDYIHFF